MIRELAAAVLALLLLTSCSQEMATEAHLPLYSKLTLRPRPEGTIARGEGAPAAPAHATLAELRRGQERFEIYCAPCHGLAGYGDGRIVQRGMLAPPSYHSDRLRSAPDQHFYDVMTQGFGAMFSYADRVGPSDRWAIVHYIRALQLSQHARLQDLPADARSKIFPREAR